MVIYLQLLKYTKLLIKYGKHFTANGGHFWAKIQDYITSIKLISFGANKLKLSISTFGSIGSIINIGH